MAKSVLYRKFASLACRLYQGFRVAAFRAMSSNQATGNAICFQPLQLVGLGDIHIEKNVKVGVYPSPMFFSTYAYLEARNPGASIWIGENTWINNNFRAIAEHTRVSIGSNCLIGSNVEILDSDFHGLKVSERRMSLPEWAAPVTIGSDVFIGNNVRILKGVSIGDGAVIANSALVVTDIPAFCIAAGVPAKVIRAAE